MNTVIGLIACLLCVAVLGLRGYTHPILIILTALLTLACTHFGQALVGWSEDIPVYQSDQAFLCTWVLALLPIIQRRLDSKAILESLRHGLVAAAALGLAIDINNRLFTVLPLDMILNAANYIVLGALYYVGLILCLLTSRPHFPWDYTAWFAGLAMMLQSHYLPSLELNTGYGAVLLLVAFLLSFSIRCYWMRRLAMG